MMKKGVWRYGLFTILAGLGIGLGLSCTPGKEASRPPGPDIDKEIAPPFQESLLDTGEKAPEPLVEKKFAVVPVGYSYKRIKIIKADNWTGDLAFSPDGGILAYRDFQFYTMRNAASESYDDPVWEYREGKAFISNFSRMSAFSPDGEYFAFVPFPQKENIALLRLKDQEYVQNISTGTEEIITLCFGSRARLASGGLEGTIEIRKLKGENLSDPQILSGHEGEVYGLAFSPDGFTLASGGRDGTARIWEEGEDGFSEKQVIPLQPYPVYSLAFSTDGKHLAIGGDDHKVRIWGYDGQRYAQMEVLDHEDTVFALAFSPDGRYLATAGGEAVIRLWERIEDHYTLAFTLTDHKKWINSLAFSPDGRYLLSGGKDRVVLIWRRMNTPDQGSFTRRNPAQPFLYSGLMP